MKQPSQSCGVNNFHKQEIDITTPSCHHPILVPKHCHDRLHATTYKLLLRPESAQQNFLLLIEPWF